MSSPSQNAKHAPALRLRITAAAERILRSGHPWLFAASILEQNRPAKPGELAILYDRRDRFLGLGLFDPDSPIRVRLLHVGKPQTVDADWWAERLHQALQKRRALFDAQTTGLRWVHGESDGWPGLVLDQYDRACVLKLYTAAWFPWLDSLLPLIRRQLDPERIVLRLSRNIHGSAQSLFGRTDGQVIWGPSLEGAVLFSETGLHFEADVLRGQKTGFFLDQRENRRQVETLAAGRHVLNAFSFSGGFSLYAARGGALSVTDVDISPHALAACRRNFELNLRIPAVARCAHSMFQADVFDWLEQAESLTAAAPSSARRQFPKGLDGPPPRERPDARRLFGLIILDPPSLAKRESERANAVRAYERLASLGLKRLSDGGILVACSCSAHVSAEEFFEAVRSAARRSGRRHQVMQTTHHPADHPAAFPEASYLKAIYLKTAC